MFCFFSRKPRRKQKSARESCILSPVYRDPLILTLTYLSIRDLANASLVCRYFAEIANLDLVWQPKVRSYIVEHMELKSFVGRPLQVKMCKMHLGSSFYRNEIKRIEQEIARQEEFKTATDDRLQSSRSDDYLTSIYLSGGVSFGIIDYSVLPQTYNNNTASLRNEMKLLKEKFKGCCTATTLESELKKHAI
ncbi:MAG: F-box protein [Gammaproteobacteria bacterium]|nr:F-box protein [Gammaproteobacteria bacterium]